MKAPRSFGTILTNICYQVIITIAIPFALIRLFVKSRKSKGYRKRITERLGFIPKNIQKPHDIWIHTVSVGEFIACLPLIKQLIAQHYYLLVTTTTPTGSALVTEKLGKSISHCYLPWDNYFLARHFIKQTQPKIAIFMETEIWPNYIKILKNQQTPSLLINARLSEKSLNNYQKFAGFAHAIFSQMTLIASQDDVSTKHFKFICDNVRTVGNLKFDITIPQNFKQTQQQIAGLLPSNQYFLAASTHPGEEKTVIETFLAHDTSHFSHLVIAPRHPERKTKIIEIAQQHNMSFSCFSQIKDTNNYQRLTAPLLIIDTIGDLLPFYANANSVFIGGSLVNHGGHNPLEPAFFGKPCLMGRHYFNFKKLVNEMLVHKAIRLCDQQSLFTNGLYQQIQDDPQIGSRAQQFLESNQGATIRYLSLIKSHLKIE